MTSPITNELPYVQILDSIADLVLVKGPKSRLLWANKAFRDYYGMSNEQLKGIIDAPFVEPDFTQQYIKDDAYVFENAKTLDIPSEPVKRHDGVVRLFHTVKSPILNSDRKVKMTVGISRDVTDTKAAEEKILFYQKIVNEMSLGLFVARLENKNDPKSFRVVLANPASEAFTGYAPLYSVGKLVEELFPGSETTDVIFKVVTEKKSIDLGQISYTYQDERGEQHYFARAFTLENDHAGILFENITERVLAQKSIEAERARSAYASKMATLGEMAAGIAHEVNTPLASIHTISGQLKEVITDEKVDLKLISEMAEKIESTALRISNIIKSLRSFSRDGSKDPKTKVEISSLIRETLVFCEEKFKHEEIKLSVVSDKKEVNLLCRPTEISQVLLNLLNNSYDALMCEKRDRSIRIEVGEEDRLIEIKVIDSGKGIPPEVALKLFQPFLTTKELNKGTGLGLSISRKIIENHGGTLTLESAHPQTCFVIRLPKE